MIIKGISDFWYVGSKIRVIICVELRTNKGLSEPAVVVLLYNGKIEEFFLLDAGYECDVQLNNQEKQLVERYLQKVGFISKKSPLEEQPLLTHVIGI